MNKKSSDKWDLIIKSERNFFQLNIFALFKYRDLIYMFVKRDFVVFYKQTILGPLWYLIQPLVNTIIFTIIFGYIIMATGETESFQSTKVAPLILVIGYCVLIPLSILYKKNE